MSEMFKMKLKLGMTAEIQNINQLYSIVPEFEYPTLSTYWSWQYVTFCVHPVYVTQLIIHTVCILQVVL